MTDTTPSIFGHRDFRQLFYSSTINQIGTQIRVLALPLVAVVALGASPLEVGVLMALQHVGLLLFGLPAGAWVDRMRRRNVMMVNDVLRVFLLGLIPLLWAMGDLHLWHLYVISALTSVCTVFFDVAYQSYLPYLVGRQRLLAGNAALEAVRNISVVGGPSAAGGLVALIGAPFAVAGNALSCLISAVFVSRIRKREEKPEPSANPHLGREVAEGLRFVFSNRSLRAIVITGGAYNLFSGVVASMLIVFLATELQLPAGYIGLAFSVSAGGALLGTLVVKPIAQRLGYGRTLWMSLVLATPFGLFLPMAQPGWTLWLGMVGYGLVWLGTTMYNICQVSFRQALTPEALLGRMNASFRVLMWGTMPLGYLLGGVLADEFGVRAALWVGSIAVLFCFLPTFFSPLRNLRELPEAVTTEKTVAR